METPRDPASVHGDVVPARDESLDPAAMEAPAELVPARYGGAWRALFGFVGIFMAFAAVVLVVESSGWTDYLMAVAAACMAAPMGFFAVTGRRPASDLLYTPSRRFLELADPSRPLVAGDPVSAGPRAEAEASHAETQRR